MTRKDNSTNTIKQGCLFIISAASGTGKTTLVQALAGTSSKLLVSVSHTTRERRPDEGDGVAYHFVDDSTFEKMIEQNQFLEHAEVFGFHYGTSRDWVKQQLDKGNNVILEIDWQGAQQVRKAMDNTVSIFLLPPTYASLEQRLCSRGEDNVATISRRMQEARQEMSHYDEFDFVVINDEFDRAFGDLISIIRATRLNYRYQSRYYDNLVTELME